MSTQQGLDPRSPLVLDTRELGRRPGNQRTMSFRAEAPPELGIEVLSVPEGAPVEIDLRLEAVMEGVLVTGEARADLEGECVRCLEPIEDTVTIDFTELFEYDDPDTRRSARREVEDADVEDDVRRLEDDLLDLEPVLRDAVVLALPFQPLCRDDCPGLCPECGARLADDPDHVERAHEDPIDPRWSGLQQLGDRLKEAGVATDESPEPPADPNSRPSSSPKE
ncbi:hypothetical protein GCM10011519_10980 [Marmoricola endophyticus]|uniref:DUF177 domain-containing protein n=1 Tax=Marmoricola endophyticus TaxID=2040280 RepID=A0A917BHC8_9ACTN|nr:DUF177 domain-containing protein [Marmoricola endophyticus]GGF39147.1 hypothetical protein GCM10011519_10980 [Marmoricola endophyticus]